MRCESCGKEYPSKFYFHSHTLCLECYRKDHPDEVNAGWTEIAEREIAGHALKCQHCDHNRFWQRKTLMNTRGLTFLGMEWANKESENYVCERCGYVTWFMRRGTDG